MHHDKYAKLGAESKQNKAILISQVARIMLQPGPLICEGCCRFLKRDTVLTLVLSGLPIVPR